MVLLLMKLDQLDQEIENALSATSSKDSTPTLQRRQLLVLNTVLLHRALTSLVFLADVNYRPSFTHSALYVFSCPLQSLIYVQMTFFSTCVLQLAKQHTLFSRFHRAGLWFKFNESGTATSFKSTHLCSAELRSCSTLWRKTEKCGELKSSSFGHIFKTNSYCIWYRNDGNLLSNIFDQHLVCNCPFCRNVLKLFRL